MLTGSHLVKLFILLYWKSLATGQFPRIPLLDNPGLRCYSCLRPEGPCLDPSHLKIVTCSPGSRFCYKLLKNSTLFLQKVAALENSTMHKRIFGPSGDCADLSLTSALWKYGMDAPECYKSYELRKTELSVDSQTSSFRFDGEICLCQGERCNTGFTTFSSSSASSRVRRRLIFSVFVLLMLLHLFSVVVLCVTSLRMTQ